VLWETPDIPVPHGAVIAFDLVYFVEGNRFKDDNRGFYFLAGRIADVATLKRIALGARNAKRNICEVMGERAMIWRQALLLTASDILNCDGDRLVKIVADRDGRPTAYEQ